MECLIKTWKNFCVLQELIQYNTKKCLKNAFMMESKCNTIY